MRSYSKAAVLFLASVALCAAQTPINTNCPNCLTSSGNTTSVAMMYNSSGLVQWIGTGTSEHDRDTIYGIPTELRKDDGKGPSIRLVRLAAKNWDALKLAPAEYMARAEKIGLSSAGTDEARLLQAIHDTQLKVYGFDKVDSYLYRQALKMGSNYRWVWEPLREKDVKPASDNSGAHSALGYVYAKQYSREVPDRVLADIERLMDCAPGDAIFLVSDFKAVNPDPFLAVTTPKMLEAGKIFIVDQWDEPGFGDEVEIKPPTVQTPSGILTIALK